MMNMPKSILQYCGQSITWIAHSGVVNILYYHIIIFDHSFLLNQQRDETGRKGFIWEPHEIAQKQGL